MEDYGEKTDSSTNRKSYIRVKSRNGEAMDLSEATLDTRVTASLKFAVSAFCFSQYLETRTLTRLHFIVNDGRCKRIINTLDCKPFTESWHLLTSVFTLFLQCETIVEQQEDEIIEFFAHETENVKDKLCSKRTGMFLTHSSL